MTKTEQLQTINEQIRELGWSNYGYGAPAFVGEGYYYVSPIGEGMPSKKGAKYTDSGKWKGASVPKEVKKLMIEYKTILNT